LAEIEDEYYQISDAASQLGVTAKTLKNWEKAGKIPKAKRDRLNRRVYTATDIVDIRERMGIGRVFDPK
jgi:DNA-binding transcriptional MerR regulator